MIFWFSGVTSHRDAALLQLAGVQHVLIDTFDWPATQLDGAPKFKHLMLDSGAYRMFRREIAWDTGDHLTGLSMITGPFDHVVALDVIGNPIATRGNWEKVYRTRNDYQFMPVWQWGAPLDDLKYYLDEAPLVGVGGLVPLIRSRRKDKLSQAEARAWTQSRLKVLELLTSLAQMYPQRLHAFGLSWLEAVNQLRPYLFSADASHWLIGRKDRMIIFQDPDSGELQEVKAKHYPYLDLADTSGDLLAVACARALNQYCNIDAYDRVVKSGG
ncbi:MAG: hypothetical protein IPO08_22720 [Xanthomonadales bacterium]|nr:hypothetical protein [Xanthomonadales bacterium]